MPVKLRVQSQRGRRQSRESTRIFTITDHITRRRGTSGHVTSLMTSARRRLGHVPGARRRARLRAFELSALDQSSKVVVVVLVLAAMR